MERMSQTYRPLESTICWPGSTMGRASAVPGAGSTYRLTCAPQGDASGVRIDGLREASGDRTGCAKSPDICCLNFTSSVETRTHDMAGARAISRRHQQTTTGSALALDA